MEPTDSNSLPIAVSRDDAESKVSCDCPKGHMSEYEWLDRDARLMVELLRALDEPIGNEALRERLEWKQAGRFARVRDSLIASGLVRRIGGGRGGRLVLITHLDWDGVVAVGTERALYHSLGRQVRDLLLRDVLKNEDDDDESIEIYNTADQGARHTGGRWTRADLTAIVTSEYPAIGQWRDVHAFEVKGYWDIGRSALYEAAAQAAMQRCSHSWLLAYIPDPDIPVGDHQREQVDRVIRLLPDLREEAERVGVGIAIATSTLDSAAIRIDSEDKAWWTGVRPRRHVIDPHQLNTLLSWLEKASPATSARARLDSGGAAEYPE